MSNYTYLVLKGIRVQHANAMTSWNVISAPPITAHVGFGMAIAHHYEMSADFKGIAILHQGLDHEGRYMYGRLEPNRVRGLPVVTNRSGLNMSKGLSGQPFAICHYEFSCVLRFEGDVSQKLMDDLTQAGYGELFLNRLKSQMRFAGGLIVRVDKILATQSKEEAFRILPKSGSWVLDRKDLIENRKEEENQLDAALSNLYPYQSPEQKNALTKEEKEEIQKNKPWLSMSSVGYSLLTKLRQTDGVRQNLDHAYAETLLGLIEYRSFRKVDLSQQAIFWQYREISPKVIVCQNFI